MITLDGSHGWVISYTNKHNISGKVVEDINKGNWTFCTSIQPEWNPNQLPPVLGKTKNCQINQLMSLFHHIHYEVKERRKYH